jgi:hypothetical protein
MATLAKLLQVDMDLPSMAKRLAAAGRGKDSILAHINPKEMALLKKHGGSGKINPETGIMEFDDTNYSDYGGTESQTPSANMFAENVAPEPTGQPTTSPAPVTPSAPAPTAPANVLAPAPQTNQGFNTIPQSSLDVANTPQENFRRSEIEAQNNPPPGSEKGVGQSVADFLKPYGESASTLSKALDPFMPYASAGYNVYQAMQARKAQQAAQEQAAANQARLEALQAPNQAQALQLSQQGNQILGQGQAGGLTAAQQQNLQTVAAQQAQKRAESGQGSAGTVAMQDAAQLQALAQQYAQQNIAQGLQLIQGGASINQGANNAIASAIDAGYKQSVDANAAANQFYQNIGSYLPASNTKINPAEKPRGNA